MKRMGIATVTLAAIVLANLATPMPAAAQATDQPPAASGAPAPQPATPPAAAPSPAAPPSPAPRPRIFSPSGGASGFGRRPTREEVTAAREACREQANAKDLIGNERAKFLHSCFGAKVPAFVKRTACRKEAKAKGYVQAGLRAYIRQCVRGRG